MFILENKEKFKKLMQDEDFLIKILELQTPSDIKNEFEANGVKISDNEVKKLTNEFGAIADAIDEEDLMDIGGGKRTWEDIWDKCWDKFAEGAGMALWIVPTAALTKVTQWYVEQKLKKYETKEENGKKKNI